MASPDGNGFTIDQMIAATDTDAFLVVHKGALIHETYYNGMQPDSVHLVNSISKTFLGILTGILVGEGAIDPEARATRYVPEFVGTAFDQTTVRQLLNMTGAAKSGEDYAVWDDDFWTETAVVGWRPDLSEKAATRSLKQYAFARSETEQRDGEHFHYRTLMTNALAMVIEGAAQAPVQQLMEQRVWQKLRPEYDASVVLDAQGFPYFGAGISASASDLARFGLMLLNDGLVEGETVVPAQWVQATGAGSDDLRTLFAASQYGAILPGWHYQNQTWACEADGLLACIGIFGQVIFIHKPSDLVIVKLSSHPLADSQPQELMAFVAMNHLASELAE
ncbi:MAG: serine hydrolase [Pseudomonadota bacterium]